MFSRKYSPTFSRFVPDVSNPPAGQTWVKSLISGSDPAVLSVPQGANVDGSKIPIFLSGRVTLYSGSTTPVFSLNICQGAARQSLFNTSCQLPVSASGLLIPFSLSLQGVYDVKTRRLYGLVWGAIINLNATPAWIGPAFFNSGSPVAPDDLNFTAWYGFTPAPLAGTIVEILEFRFGL